jgi:hypothetical protein
MDSLGKYNRCSSAHCAGRGQSSRTRWLPSTARGGERAHAPVTADGFGGTWAAGKPCRWTAAARATGRVAFGRYSRPKYRRRRNWRSSSSGSRRTPVACRCRSPAQHHGIVGAHQVGRRRGRDRRTRFTTLPASRITSTRRSLMTLRSASSAMMLGDAKSQGRRANRRKCNRALIGAMRGWARARFAWAMFWCLRTGPRACARGGLRPPLNRSLTRLLLSSGPQAGKSRARIGRRSAPPMAG